MTAPEAPATAPDTAMQLEETLKAQLKDRGASPIILSIGARGSGKSFHMLSMLMWCLDNRCYDKYHCVLPTWSYEQHDSYAFMKDKKHVDKIFVYEKWKSTLPEAILKRKETADSSRILLIIDDAGAASDRDPSLKGDQKKINSFHDDPYLPALLSVARHKQGLSCWIGFHSLASADTLSVFLRQQVTWVWQYRISNSKLLEQVYLEQLSLSLDGQSDGDAPGSGFRKFRGQFYEHTKGKYSGSPPVLAPTYNGIAIETANGAIDFGLREWFLKEKEKLKKLVGGKKRKREEEEEDLSGYVTGM